MSDNFGEFTVPPGWYPDPADPASLRRWDGEGWTTDVVPVADSATQPVPQPVELEFEPEPVAPPAPDPEPAPVPEPVAEPSPRRSMDPDFSDWPDLPGLTLPPDLSSIPGMRQESGFPMPNFEDAADEEPAAEAPAFDLPSFDHPAFDQPARVSPPLFTEPVFTDPEPEPEPQPEPEPEPEPNAEPEPDAEPEHESPPAEPRTRREMRNGRASSAPVADDARATKPAVSQPAAPYAPPPAGVQYIAPLPPGVDNVEPAPNAYPASSLGNRITPSWTDAQPSSPTPPAVPASETPVPAPVPRALRPLGIPATAGSSTLGVWLIAILPLLQFAAVYYAFGLLSEPLVSGVEWGVLAAPAIFALIFATLDGRKLRDQGFQRVPSALWAVIPPLYLLVRCFRIGPRSISALVVWFVFQAAAVAGVYLLLPAVLSEALGTPIAAATPAASQISPNGAKPLSAAARAEQLTQKGMQAKILNDTRTVFKVQSVKCPALSSTATGTTVVCTAKTKTQTLLLTERVDNAQAFVAFVQTQMKAKN